MGVRGPVPKRAAERRRVNKESAPETVTFGQAVPPPDKPDGLHLVADHLWEAVKTSGQSQFYEATDWAIVEFIVLGMTKCLNAKQMSAVMFSSVMSAANDLLMTEGSRRRARLEIERHQPPKEEAPAGVTALENYRRRTAK